MSDMWFASAFSPQRFCFYFVDGFFTVCVCVCVWSMEFTTCVFFWEFYGFWPYVPVFTLFWVAFCGCWKIVQSSFILVCVAVQYPQHRVLKGLFFTHMCSCLLCCINWPNVWVYFWALSSVPLICASVFRPVPYCLITISLQYSLKSGNMMPPVLFFLKFALANYTLLWFRTSFMIVLFLRGTLLEF